MSPSNLSKPLSLPLNLTPSTREMTTLSFSTTTNTSDGGLVKLGFSSLTMELGINRVLKLNHGAFCGSMKVTRLVWVVGRFGFVGYVLVVGGRYVLCIVVKPQIGGGFGSVWIHGLWTVVERCCETQINGLGWFKSGGLGDSGWVSWVFYWCGSRWLVRFVVDVGHSGRFGFFALLICCRGTQWLTVVWSTSGWLGLFFELFKFLSFLCFWVLGLFFKIYKLFKI